MKKSALVVLDNDTPITTSRIVAEQFDKKHKDVLEAVENIVEQMASNQESGIFRSLDLFQKSYYEVKGQMRKYPMYTMTRDGFSLLAMGFTGKKALEFKLKFINEFNRMEETLKKLADKGTLAWLQTRQLVKATRRIFTGAVKTLEMHLADNGQIFPPGYIYGHLTNVIQNALGIEKGTRDKQTQSKLNQLKQAEDTAGIVILRGISGKTIKKLAEADALILLQLRKLNDALCGQLFLPDGGNANA